MPQCFEALTLLCRPIPRSGLESDEVHEAFSFAAEAVRARTPPLAGGQ
jgi:hypothetical protein